MPGPEEYRPRRAAAFAPHEPDGPPDPDPDEPDPEDTRPLFGRRGIVPPADEPAEPAPSAEPAPWSAAPAGPARPATPGSSVPSPFPQPSPVAPPVPDPWAVPPTGPGAASRPPTRPVAGLAPIEVRGLVKRFGPVTAVDDVTFTVAPGRVTGFLGPNGAGKTTTLRMLVGLATPTAGTATFGEARYVDLPHPQQTVGVALEANFHPGRTGRNHLRVLAATAGVGDDRVEQVLELVQLSGAARRSAGGYSLGMRQRLALAGALLGDPDYLILDEPANGLDPEGIRWLRGFLRDYAATGRVVLVSSHMLSEVQQTVDDVVIIGHGRLLRVAPIDQLETAPPTVKLRTADLQATADALDAAGFGTEPAHDHRGVFIRVHTPDSAAVGRFLLDHGIAVVELVTEQLDLEESFFRMLEREVAS